MNTTEAYLRLFDEIAARQQWHRGSSPTEILDAWEHVVGLIEDGYDDNIYEYDNDLFVRDLIEALLHDDRLRDVEPMRGFRERVAQIDTRFRALLTGQPVGAAGQPWWRASLPRYAGPELAADFRSTYGVSVEER